jgi:glutamate formiminotransferase/formiminotetrahydrofolate cyclodeaminase
VKALGFDIAERHRAQVSMNLTDYRVTPVHRALEAVRREAQRYGVGVEESEIVGLVPEDALFDAAEYYLQLHSFERSAVLERKVRASETSPAVESLAAFTARLSARTPTPGGGSASAAAGAMAAALGEMVLAYSIDPAKPDPELTALSSRVADGRRRLLELVEEDAQSYDAVRLARKARKAHSGPTEESAYVAALQRAAEVPLSTARLARGLATALEAVRARTKAALGSDLTTALALFAATAQGALANVEINLIDLRTAQVPTDTLEREVALLRVGG